MTYIDTAKFDASNLSAFGVLETAELTPIFQGDFVFGLNNQMWQTPVTSGAGATVDTNAARLRIQSGTASTGYAYILSRIPLRYRAGQGTVIRNTGFFTAGVANNIQIWGVGAVQSNAPYDGYFFGCNGVSFGIVHYVRGVATWTAQSAWNVDKVDGSAGSSFTLDPTKGTPVFIKYPYLGFGDIFFYVQHPTTGRPVLVHVIRYANAYSTTQLSNPTMYIMGYTANSGNTTNVTMYNGSVGAFISGTRSYIGNPRGSADASKGSVTTETNLISIKNATTYNGVSNRGLIRLTSISFGSSAASGDARLRFKYGVTLGGTPAFAPYSGTTADNGATITSGNSIASTDTAGTTITGGRQEFALAIDNPNSTFVDLIPYEIFIAPSEVLTISGFSSATSTQNIAVNWSEDI